MRYPQEGKQWSAKDCEQARGLGSIDYNRGIVLVRSPVDEVARAIAGDAETWEPDVLGRAVIGQPQALFVFRLCGHPWSIVVGIPEEEETQRLPQ
jgi:hypothetical protein